MGFFDLFRKKQDTPADKEQAPHRQEELDAGLEKTKTGLFSKLARAVAGRTTIDADAPDEPQGVLLSAALGGDTNV